MSDVEKGRKVKKKQLDLKQQNHTEYLFNLRRQHYSNGKNKSTKKNR